MIAFWKGLNWLAIIHVPSKKHTKEKFVTSHWQGNGMIIKFKFLSLHFLCVIFHGAKQWAEAVKWTLRQGGKSFFYFHQKHVQGSSGVMVTHPTLDHEIRVGRLAVRLRSESSFSNTTSRMQIWKKDDVIFFFHFCWTCKKFADGAKPQFIHDWQLKTIEPHCSLEDISWLLHEPFPVLDHPLLAADYDC